MTGDKAKYTHMVANVKEAVALAKKFKSEGKFNVFRGQARNWDVFSTLHRIKEKDFQRSKDKIERFIFFISQNEDLVSYMDDFNSVFAIAQHYGLPTNYIDFTHNPEVAAYFATNSKKNKKGQYASIICLDTKDFAEFIEFYKPHFFTGKLVPEIIDVNVQNLWRLQAQEGCFLFTPEAGIEHYYYFDRILFPFEDKYSCVTEHQIYPVRKSQLEIYLDNFFMHERIVHWHEFMAEHMPGVPITHGKGHSISRYIKSDVPTHSSWIRRKISIWSARVDEKWNDIQSEIKIELQFHYKRTYEEIVLVAEQQILSNFKTGILKRNMLFDFEITRLTRNICKKDRELLQSGCGNIWDGIRLLPYSDQQIAICIARYIGLFLSHSTDESDHYFSLLPNSIYIEMSYGDGSHSRANVCGYKILKSIRPNIDEYIRKKHKPILANNPLALVQCINTPQYLFDFEKLCHLFCEDIIPTQVVLKGRDTAEPIYFNPAKLTVLGLA